MSQVYPDRMNRKTPLNQYASRRRYECQIIQRDLMTEKYQSRIPLVISVGFGDPSMLEEKQNRPSRSKHQAQITYASTPLQVGRDKKRWA
ncbi:hypothetical protein J6590_019628 [Homalodisca vitripennis]|nr:hypothetical protein J6590_019628 [Homalodisca vitripennis]